MSDPKRWSEDGDAGQLERELLAAGQAVKLPDRERRALWASIALSMPVPAPAPVPTQLSQAAHGALRGYLTKGAVFLATVGGLTFGASRLWPRTELAVVKPAPSSAAPGPMRASIASAAVSEPAPAAVVPTPTPVGKPSSDGRIPSASQLREESLAVLDARAALRRGDAARSLALLEQARARFPRGALGQEREALTIEALSATGQTSAARRSAEAFLRAHPQSPYAVDVRRISAR